MRSIMRAADCALNRGAGTGIARSTPRTVRFIVARVVGRGVRGLRDGSDFRSDAGTRMFSEWFRYRGLVLTRTVHRRIQSMAQSTNRPTDIDGLVTLPSPYPVGETLDRLEAVLRVKEATIFARIDHRAGAERVGLAMRSAQVLIFGNPKVGTPVMVAAPTIAIDLPFKALAWEDAAGKVWLSCNSAEYLARRHKVAADVIRPLAAIEALIATALK
jgi:uncharacterized protein (DUF302 family)